MRYFRSNFSSFFLFATHPENELLQPSIDLYSQLALTKKIRVLFLCLLIERLQNIFY